MRKFIYLFFFVFVICACDSGELKAPETLREYFSSANPDVESGGVKMLPVTTASGTHYVWTKKFGSNPRIRVLLLHGGPGGTHEYFECMESFLPAEGIEFIYYDQLGSGNSEKPADSSLWTTDRFVEEVEQVRQALRMGRKNFYLLGHSWGGILAMEYALKYGQHLKGLVISNMMSSCPAYDRYADEVLAPLMDVDVLDSIRKLEEKGAFDDPLYMKLLIPHFYERHILRMPHDRWPEPVLRSFSRFNLDIYRIMQGPSEFGIAGRLANWDRSRDIGSIKVPTLVIGSRHDTMDPAHMEWMSKQFPLGKYLFCPNGSHMCMYDDQEVYMSGLISFLKETAEK